MRLIVPPARTSSAKITLTADERASRALARLARAAIEDVVDRRAVVLAQDDAAGPHRLRVSLRRLRSLLHMMRSIADTDANRQLARSAQELGRRLAKVRDLDVLQSEIAASAPAAQTGDAGRADLVHYLDALRTDHLDAARAALINKAWTTFESRSTAFMRSLPGKSGAQKLDDPSILAFSRAALAKAWRRVAKQGRRIARLDVEQRHELRKDLKRLQHAVRCFGPLYRKRRVAAFAAKLKDVQDGLGYLNDVVTATTAAGAMAEDAALTPRAHQCIGFVVGWHGAKADKRLKRMPRAWKQLAAAPRFWK